MNLTQAGQINIVDSKYISYVQQQTKKRIARIGQINHSTVHIFVRYNVKTEKKIKRHHYKCVIIIKRIVCPKTRKNKLLKYYDLICLFTDLKKQSFCQGITSIEILKRK